MSNTNNDLAAIAAQGKGTQAKAEDQKFTKAELLSKYFNPRVPDGQDSATFKVRIIPNPEGGSPFKEVKFHSAKVGKQYPKFLCLEELGHDCPFCETADGFTEQGEKEKAKPYKAHSFYIVKVLDRAKEGEGVKFWRFKRNFKGQGEFDKIVALINAEFDILATDNTGFDLQITCGLNDKKKSVITSILCTKPSALADSQEKIDALINADIDWKDVFKPKTVEYLEDVIAGKAQYWDDTLKKFVTPGKENASTEETLIESNDSAVKEVSTKIEDNPLIKDEKIGEDNILSGDDDDDLPF